MSTKTQDVTTAEDDVQLQSPATAEAASAAIDVVLADLADLAEDFLSHVTQIQRLQENGFFQYTSKKTRNDLLNGLLEKADAIDEGCKGAFRALKKVKRQHVPEEVVDALLVGRVTPVRL
jgi:hypothetical protein